MKKIYLVVLILILCSSVVFADSPPSWEEFEIESNNKKYIAEIIRDENNVDKDFKEDKYKIIVKEKNSNNVKWSCKYFYNGYPGGILSNDGSTFVYIDFWFNKDKPIVYIYYKGLKVNKILGKHFKIDESFFINTASHQLWLDKKSKTKYNFSRYKDKLILEITTIDSKKHLIDIISGNFINK